MLTLTQGTLHILHNWIIQVARHPQHCSLPFKVLVFFSSAWCRVICNGCKTVTTIPIAISVIKSLPKKPVLDWRAIVSCLFTFTERQWTVGLSHLVVLKGKDIFCVLNCIMMSKNHFRVSFCLFNCQHISSVWVYGLMLPRAQKWLINQNYARLFPFLIASSRTSAKWKFKSSLLFQNYLNVFNLLHWRFDEKCETKSFLDLFHWVCLDKWARSMPANTAPAGYTCPTCQECVFPSDKLVSPVADALRKVLADVNWARAGLGLPLLEERSERKPHFSDVPSGPRPAPEGESMSGAMMSDGRVGMAAKKDTLIQVMLGMEHFSIKNRRINFLF